MKKIKLQCDNCGQVLQKEKEVTDKVQQWDCPGCGVSYFIELADEQVLVKPKQEFRRPPYNLIVTSYRPVDCPVGTYFPANEFLEGWK